MSTDSPLTTPVLPALPPAVHARAALSQDTLRNRKRTATRLAIRRAAIELGLEHGYENVTVDMICAVSTVSARTFFNYFGSKEGVYVSPTRVMPTPEQHRAFVAGSGSSVFGDLFNMIAETFVSVDADFELFQARHQLIHQTLNFSTGKRPGSVRPRKATSAASLTDTVSTAGARTKHPTLRTRPAWLFPSFRGPCALRCKSGWQAISPTPAKSWSRPRRP